MPQVLRASHRLALAAALGWLVPIAQAADLHMQFKNWSVTCGGDRYCTAGTRLRSSDPQLPYAFRLRVSRYHPGGREIAFLPAREPPAGDAELGVRVDSKPTLTLAPGTGYRAVGGGNTYVVSDADSAAALIEAMRTGRRVEFSYRTAQGKPVVANFPLDGFAPALAVVDPRPVRRAQPTPAAPSEPSAAPAPARASEPAPDPTAAPTQESAATPEAPGAAPQPAIEPVATPAASRSRTRNASKIADAGTSKAATSQAGGPLAGRKRVRAVRQFACRGNEPAWNLIIDNDKGRFELMLGGGAPDAIALTGRLKVTGEGRTPDVDWRGKSVDGRAYRALIQQQSCADSMSDAEGQTEFDYRVQLTVPGGRMLSGCCNAGVEPPRAAPAARIEPDPAQAPIAALGAKSPADWSRTLMELMPAINACLERTPGSAAYVTKAWPMHQGLVAVRTRNATVGWYECIARSDGQAIEAFGPVESTAPPVPGEEIVLYTPATQSPPAGNCFTHERVLDATGTQLGWLSSNTCATQDRAALTR